MLRGITHQCLGLEVFSACEEIDNVLTRSVIPPLLGMSSGAMAPLVLVLRESVPISKRGEGGRKRKSMRILPDLCNFLRDLSRIQTRPRKYKHQCVSCALVQATWAF